MDVFLHYTDSLHVRLLALVIDGCCGHDRLGREGAHEGRTADHQHIVRSVDDLPDSVPGRGGHDVEPGRVAAVGRAHEHVAGVLHQLHESAALPLRQNLQLYLQEPDLATRAL